MKVATPRLFASGIAVSGDKSLGVRIIGIDPASAANAPFRDGMLSGEFLTADDREGILIGQTAGRQAGPESRRHDQPAGQHLQRRRGRAAFHHPRHLFHHARPASTRAPSSCRWPRPRPSPSTENHASTIFILLKDRDQTDAVAAALQTSRLPGEDLASR